MIKRFLLVLLVLVLSVSIVGCGSEEAVTNEASQEEASVFSNIQQSVMEGSENSSSSLGMTLTEFAQSFDEVSKDLAKDGLVINALDFKDGKLEDSYVYEINRRIVLLAIIGQKDKRVREFRVTAQPSEFNSENMETVAVFNLVVMALNPDWSDKQVEALFKELKFNNSKDLTRLNSKAIRNNNEYRMEYKDKIGVILSVKNKGDV